MPGCHFDEARSSEVCSWFTVPSSVESGTFDFDSSLTISLADVSLMRATSIDCILGSCGKRLRSTVGGIGHTSESTEYDRWSFEVKKFDVFLSHSWHAPWWKKFLVLLFRFNLIPAICFSCTLSFGYNLVVRLRFKKHNEHVFQHMYHTGTLPWVGCISFFGVLCTWHYLARLLTSRVRIFPILSPAVFLDKVCIHQTDPNRKAAGIRSLGAFLKSTRRLLVVLDRSYFERLWCTYELSAFTFANPNGIIDVVPCDFGPVFLVVLGCSWFKALVNHIFVDNYLFFYQSMDWVTFSYDACLSFWLFSVFCSAIRSFRLTMASLFEQLASYSAHECRCFCCDNNHVMPESGEVLPCDREQVYETIASWHGQGDRDRGLATFHRKMRGRFRERMTHRLGSWSLASYSNMVALGVPWFCVEMDTIVLMPEPESLWVNAMNSINLLLLKVPFTVLVISFMSTLCVCRLQSWYANTIIILLLGLASTAIYLFLALSFEFAKGLSMVTQLTIYSVQVISLAINFSMLKSQRIQPDKDKNQEAIELATR